MLDAGVVIVDGKKRRWQKTFGTKKAAELEKKRLDKMRRRHGEDSWKLSPGAIARYGEAERTLAAAGVTLEDAVKWAVDHAARGTKRMTVSQMWDGFLAAQRAHGIRARYEQSLVSCGNAFKRACGDLLIADMTREKIATWLDGGGWAWKTRKNYLGYVGSAFKWAVEEGKALLVSPVSGVKIGKEPRKNEVAVFAPAACEKLLRKCVEHRDRVWDRRRAVWVEDVPVFEPLLGYVAAAMFGGVRPAELERCSIADLDLEGRTLIVDEVASKTPRRRVVELSGNAVAWLSRWRELCPEQRGFLPKGWFRLWTELRKKAELWPWPADGLRHTFATMHYAEHANLALLKAQMGHWESEATLHRHYRALRTMDGRVVSREIARVFWAIVPDPESPDSALSDRAGDLGAK